MQRVNVFYNNDDSDDNDPGVGMQQNKGAYQCRGRVAMLRSCDHESLLKELCVGKYFYFAAFGKSAT